MKLCRIIDGRPYRREWLDTENNDSVDRDVPELHCCNSLTDSQTTDQRQCSSCGGNAVADTGEEKGRAVIKCI